MASNEKNFDVVRRYHFRKNGVVDSQGYDWIGEARYGLYPVELDGKLGFADNNGKIVIPVIYNTEYHINNTIQIGNEEFFNLRKNGLYGLVRHDGTVAVDFCFEGIHLDKLSERLIPVSINRKWGFVNVKTGKTQIKPEYDEVGPFRGGFAPVCLNHKWGMISSNGILVLEVKYLLESYFEDDFAIVFEGGICRRGPWNSVKISESNCKLVDKKGYELVSGCSWINKTGVNTFTISKMVDNSRKVEMVKQFLPFSDYIVVIDNGKYESGYITTDGRFSRRFIYDAELGIDSIHYPNARYLGGGTWSVIDYTGKEITIPESELQKIKESLLA